MYIQAFLRAQNLELGAATSFKEALLGLLPVDDIPDGVQILSSICQNRVSYASIDHQTYINLDVEVLQVECVLPDVHANDGDEGQERVLVSSGGDLKTLGADAPALYAVSLSNPRTFDD